MDFKRRQKLIEWGQAAEELGGEDTQK